MLSAALRALRQDLPARLQAFAGSADGELVFDSQLRVCWGGGPVARLLPSGDILAPKVEALPSDLLDGPAREEVRKRAAAWVETRIRLGLSELMDARATAELPAGARGIVFQLCEGLGVLPRRPIEQQLGRTRRGGPQGAGAARRAGRRLFALFPEHAEAGADPPARRPLDDRAQPRDHPAAAGRGPHLDGPAARRRARVLRHHRLPAAGRPRHPRRHGRAPGGDGAPGRRAKAAKRAPRPAGSKQEAERRRQRSAAGGDSAQRHRPTRSANGRSSPQPSARTSRRAAPEPRERRGTPRRSLSQRTARGSRPSKTARPAKPEETADAEPKPPRRRPTAGGGRSATSRRDDGEAARPRKLRPKSQGRRGRRRQARGRCRPAGSAPRRR